MKAKSTTSLTSCKPKFCYNNKAWKTSAITSKIWTKVKLLPTISMESVLSTQALERKKWKLAPTTMFLQLFYILTMFSKTIWLSKLEAISVSSWLKNIWLIMLTSRSRIRKWKEQTCWRIYKQFQILRDLMIWNMEWPSKLRKQPQIK